MSITVNEEVKDLIRPLTEDNLEAIRKNLLHLMGREPSKVLLEEIERFLSNPNYHGKISAQDFLKQAIRDSYSLSKESFRDNSETAVKAILVDVGQSWRIKS